MPQPADNTPGLRRKKDADHHHRQDGPSAADKNNQLEKRNGDNTVSASGTADGITAQAVTAVSSLLHPRVAVVLGLSEAWHPLLFACRLLSTLPAVWWGFPIALRLLAQLHPLAAEAGLNGKGGTGAGGSGPGWEGGLWCGPCARSFESRLRLTETVLAIIWCGASAYLSFFFTDCLMSRWLLNYTPQATLVRLLTISALNGYLTSWVLFLTGGSQDPRLFLPAWIAIATTLTIIYHITQRKINIRKETSMTISVFSIASFTSMVALLGQLHLNRSDYPKNVPFFSLVMKAWQQLGKLAVKVVEYGNGGREL